MYGVRLETEVLRRRSCNGEAGGGGGTVQSMSRPEQTVLRHSRPLLVPPAEG